MPDIALKIPAIFEAYVDIAIVRFQYLYPEVNIQQNGLEISYEENKSHSNDDLKQEILHLIYKEKIYAETLEIRNSLYRSISDG